MGNDCRATKSNWDLAIEVATEELRVATEELRRAETRERSLRLAIRTFQQNRKEGVRWPGHSETINDRLS